MTPACSLPLPANEIVKAGLHDVVGYLLFPASLAIGQVRLAANPESFTQCRPGPSDITGAGQYGNLKRREIADADKQRALFNGFGDFFVVNTTQNAG